MVVSQVLVCASRFNSERGSHSGYGLRLERLGRTQSRIADRLGASKAMVNRVLQHLAQGGYIEVTRERIVLLKQRSPRW